MKIRNRRTIPEEWFKTFVKLCDKHGLSKPTEMKCYMAFYNDGTTPEKLVDEFLSFEKRQDELYLIW